MLLQSILSKISIILNNIHQKLTSISTLLNLKKSNYQSILNNIQTTISNNFELFQTGFESNLIINKNDFFIAQSEHIIIEYNTMQKYKDYKMSITTIYPDSNNYPNESYFLNLLSYLKIKENWPTPTNIMDFFTLAQSDFSQFYFSNKLWFYLHTLKFPLIHQLLLNLRFNKSINELPTGFIESNDTIIPASNRFYMLNDSCLPIYGSDTVFYAIKIVDPNDNESILLIDYFNY